MYHNSINTGIVMKDATGAFKEVHIRSIVQLQKVLKLFKDIIEHPEIPLEDHLNELDIRFWK